ncbi:hypothetical protein Gogos_009980 [Gossypium gossypioides]|uniref:RNase H type-1 domain-containing protein n=1 Tax=Gossypium gossypioides TaxID=34282 RepID=A0A7J9BJT5_GOSGO|nr:hypothetical protein [Gossypium gossypioides]
MGSRMIINYHIPTLFAAEALACLQRVQMGLDLGFKKVVVERDNLRMIKKLQTQRQDDSVIMLTLKMQNEPIEDLKNACLGISTERQMKQAIN